MDEVAQRLLSTIWFLDHYRLGVYDGFLRPPKDMGDTSGRKLPAMQLRIEDYSILFNGRLENIPAKTMLHFCKNEMQQFSSELKIQI